MGCENLAYLFLARLTYLDYTEQQLGNYIRGTISAISTLRFKMKKMKYSDITIKLMDLTRGMRQKNSLQ